jgi:hypothetical protein
LHGYGQYRACTSTAAYVHHHHLLLLRVTSEKEAAVDGRVILLFEFSSAPEAIQGGHPMHFLPQLLPYYY